MKKVLSFIAMLFFGYIGFRTFSLLYNFGHDENISNTKIVILEFIVIVVCMLLTRFFWKKFREPNENN